MSRPSLKPCRGSLFDLMRQSKGTLVFSSSFHSPTPEQKRLRYEQSKKLELYKREQDSKRQEEEYYYSYEGWFEREMTKACDTWYDAWLNGCTEPPPWIKLPSHLEPNYNPYETKSEAYGEDYSDEEYYSFSQEEDDDGHPHDDYNHEDEEWEEIRKK